MPFFIKSAVSRGAIVDNNTSLLHKEVQSLKESRKHLKSEVIRLTAEVETLKRKLDTTFQFFEIRVDEIYRKIADSSHSLDAIVKNDRSATLLPTNPEWEKLIFAAKSPYLESGPIPSPITLSGMRIDTRYAVEKLHYTFIEGGLSEIAVFGPYRRLLPGSYTLELALEPAESGGQLALLLEVFTTVKGNEMTIAERQIETAHETRLLFDWEPELADCEAQFRVHQRGGDAVRLYGLDLNRA